jgi:hypothetical protein
MVYAIDLIPYLVGLWITVISLMFLIAPILVNYYLPEQRPWIVVGTYDLKNPRSLSAYEQSLRSDTATSAVLYQRQGCSEWCYWSGKEWVFPHIDSVYSRGRTINHAPIVE